ncbi:hypothetical protein HWV62_42207 [Athelia sp. TMB]|nr:hypothetical protein HWV62_42207 [Athelia sp. TMB]
MKGICLLLVPPWAFRPAPPAVGLAVQRARGRAKVQLEPKWWTTQRNHLDSKVEAFINTMSDNVCCHTLLREVFRPETSITTYTLLTRVQSASTGSLSQRSSYELSWTVLDRNHVLASGSDDPRLFAFSNDFIYPLAPPPSRPVSAASQVSASSTASATFLPIKQPPPVVKSDKQKLRVALTSWLTVCHARRGNSVFILKDFGLPPKQLDKLVENCGKFLSSTSISKKEILKVVKLDLALEENFLDITRTISNWRDGLNVRHTPQSQCRPRKKTRINTPLQPLLSQPQFESSVPRTPAMHRSNNALISLSHSIYTLLILHFSKLDTNADSTVLFPASVSFKCKLSACTK